MSGVIQRLLDRAAPALPAVPLALSATPSGSPVASFDQRLQTGLFDDLPLPDLAGPGAEPVNAAPPPSIGTSPGAPPPAAHPAPEDPAPRLPGRERAAQIAPADVPLPAKQHPGFGGAAVFPREARAHPQDGPLTAVPRQAPPIAAPDAAPARRDAAPPDPAAAPATTVVPTPDPRIAAPPPAAAPGQAADPPPVAPPAPPHLARTIYPEPPGQATDPAAAPQVPEPAAAPMPTRVDTTETEAPSLAIPPPPPEPLAFEPTPADAPTPDPSPKIIERIVRETPAPTAETARQMPRAPLSVDAISRIGPLPERRRTHSLFGLRRR